MNHILLFTTVLTALLTGGCAATSSRPSEPGHTENSTAKGTGQPELSPLNPSAGEMSAYCKAKGCAPLPGKH